jgi:hypothetical protein
LGEAEGIFFFKHAGQAIFMYVFIIQSLGVIEERVEMTGQKNKFFWVFTGTTDMVFTDILA